tara:strand:- start:222 stop:416 length:195 start_codon:yes stop_codon:yes gene_type:complete
LKRKNNVDVFASIFEVISEMRNPEVLIGTIRLDNSVAGIVLIMKGDLPLQVDSPRTDETDFALV